jgi:periplasmic copper chaperone A
MRKRPNVKRLFESLILLLTLGGAAQGAAMSAPVTIANAWFRFLPAGLPAGGYFTAHNAGKADLAITGAQSPACGMLMLHKSSDTGGMTGMNMVEKVAIPGDGTATFAPGGFHLMCDQPNMKVGSTVPVTLQLSDGSSVKASFAVKDARGK